LVAIISFIFDAPPPSDSSSHQLGKESKMKKVSVLLVMALLCVPLFGQAAQAQNDKKMGGAGTDEQYIIKEVHHELVMLPYYTLFDNFEYKVQGSTVTLLGQVTNPVLKSDAESAVKGIKGVQKVINDIEVLPLSPMDNQTRRAEFRAIYGYPSLSIYAWGAVPPIHIIVKNGHVTLEGVVDSQADKDTAGILAKGVPDVFSVTNNLRVVKPGKD
jgi:hyperosmotically inducible protein